MNRTINKSNVGAGQVRYDITIEGTLSPGQGSRGFADLILMMRHITDTPDLVRHGSDCPAQVSFEYDGITWKCHAVCFADAPKE